MRNVDMRLNITDMGRSNTSAYHREFVIEVEVDGETTGYVYQAFNHLDALGQHIEYIEETQ